jgi:ParB-like chromosome segregation protein Spo0J
MIPVGGLAQAHESLAPLLVDITSVHPHPDNPWNGDTDAIATSIEINGLYRPVYAQRDGTLLAGNHTTAALLSLGATQVPVVWLDVDDATARRILLVDNKSAQLGAYDDSLLLSLLDAIATTDSLLGTGWADQDVEDLRLLVDRLDHQEFTTIPPDLPTAHKCPACGYEWNGNAVQP